MALLLRHLLQRPVPLLLLLAFLLAASAHGAPSGSNESYDSSFCLWEPSSCGDVKIDYPFYLYDKTPVLPGNNDSHCGYPGLGIQCEDSKAVMIFDKYWYRVTNINYNNFTVSLVYPEVFEYDSCLRVDHNLTFPPSKFSWLSYPDSGVDYLFFFSSCGSIRISPINCGSSAGQTAGPFYVWPWIESPPKELFVECKSVIQVPVLQLPEYSPNDSRWTNEAYYKALQSGFHLEWDETTKSPACAQCEESGGKCGYNRTGEFMTCLCSDGSVKAPTCQLNSSGSGHRNRVTITIITSMSCLLLLCLLIMSFFLARKYDLLPIKSKEEPRIQSFLHKNGNLHPKRYTYAEVKRMTKSFSVKLGQGGFGAVYRGNVSDGREVAVKILNDSKGQGEDFLNEVASISRTSHVNIVSLLGFCLQGSKRALIYEYMSKGSLERYAFNRNFESGSTLTWEKLFDIAIGIARGLEYLHRGCNTRIVHFDIKPHNILLDQDFCPKISDFGLAKLCLNKESAISITGARGTIGYIAPEVYSKQFGTVSSKSDVYSYGMMVLEMVGARDKNNNASSESSSQYFPQWIYQHLDDYCFSASEINGETTELVRKMIVVGLWCIQVTPTNRPTMTKVVEMLEGSTGYLKLPPKMLLSW